MKNLVRLLVLLIVLGIQMTPVKCENVTLENGVHSKVNNLLYNLDLDKYNNLMIVAHPDDEALFGGAELLKEDYVVVCVTCGKNPIRLKEFNDAMNFTGDIGIPLGYIDTVDTDDYFWASDYEKIKNDLKDIINSNNWNKIVTHNKKGEYGHYHHRLVNKLVTGIAPIDLLYYFGNYYTYYELEELNLKPMNEEMYSKKLELLDKYDSQYDIIQLHLYNTPYESIVKYSDYKE